MISIFKNEETGKICSFSIIELIESHHHSIGDFILYHTKLAGNDPDYNSLNFAKIGLRNGLATGIYHYHEKPVYCFMKDIPPGFAINCLPTTYINFNLKKNICSRELLELAAHLAGEKIYEDTMLCKLKLKNSILPYSINKTMSYYQEIIRSGYNKAMPIFLSMIFLY